MRSFCRGAGHLDLEVANEWQITRDTHHEIGRQPNTAERCILDHDWNARSIRDMGEMLADRWLIELDACAMVGWHQHDQFCTTLGRVPCAQCSDPGAEVAASDHNGHAACDMGKAEFGQLKALLVRQQELLGIIG